MENSKTARLFLGLNAAFSLIVGLDILFATNTVAEMLFLQKADWQILALRVLGVGLLIFALDLMLMAKNRFLSKKLIFLITCMDIGWVVGSIMLVTLAAHLFTSFGIVAIIVIAAFVAVFAVGQYYGTTKMTPFKSRASVETVGDQLIAKVTRYVNAPVDVVWDVMNDHPAYADVADNISKVEVVSGDGIGMQRRCYGPKGENWLETCDLYEDKKVYGFEIHTEAEDYPYPFSQLRGEWSVSTKDKGSEFTINIKAKLKGNFIVQTLFILVAKSKFKGVLIDLADAWALKMERRK